MSKKSVRVVGLSVVVVSVAFLTILLMRPTSAASPARQASAQKGSSNLAHAGSNVPVSSPTGAMDDARPVKGVLAHVGLGASLASNTAATTKAPVPVVVARIMSQPGAWTHTTRLIFRVAMSSSASTTWLRPQVEVVRVGQSFAYARDVLGPRTDAAHHGKDVPATIAVSGLRNNTVYRWRVRVRDVRHGGASPWIETAGAWTHVYTWKPTVPTLAASALLEGNWSSSRRVSVRWTGALDPIGLRGFSYSVSSHPWVRPYFKVNTTRRHAAFTLASNGTWYVAVRALNRAGMWGEASVLTVHVDTARPTVDVVAHAAKIDPAGSPRQPLLDLHLSDWDHVYVDVLNARGHSLRTLATLLHAPGGLGFVWGGRDSSGARLVNQTVSLRVTVRNRAGLQRTATYPVRIQNPTPTVSDGQSQTGTYNLYNDAINGPEVLTATIDTPAQMRIDAIRDGETLRSWSWPSVKAGETITATWNGRLASGAIMPGGTYQFRVSHTDIYGAKGHTQIGWVVLDRRRVVVSLAQQRLWALDGDKVLMTTLVTTGGPELPTPTGDFQIIDRESPFTFHSPFPLGSPFWYADSPTNFALLFQINGYFIHDAPWRNVYGPGSNTTDGTPGGNYTGTHGCVNTPYYSMQWLFNWATMYTPVQVRSDFSTSALA